MHRTHDFGEIILYHGGCIGVWRESLLHHLELLRANASRPPPVGLSKIGIFENCALETRQRKIGATKTRALETRPRKIHPGKIGPCKVRHLTIRFGKISQRKVRLFGLDLLQNGASHYGPPAM